MLKSMYSGISAMKANQSKMDIVGNNVANVGTTSFKKSSARFSDTLYQTIIHSTAPTGTIGGSNPGQVGLGTNLIGVFKNMSQGNLQPTGRNTDMAMDGNSMFVVEKSGQRAFTRDGSFTLDAAGNLVNGEGYMVLGTTDANIGTDVAQAIRIPQTVTDANGDSIKVLSFSVSKDGAISLSLENGTKAPLTTDTMQGGAIGQGEEIKVKTANFMNVEGLEGIGGNLYLSSANSGEPVYGNVSGSIIQGAIEMSNVDLSEEFTDMIVTTRSFQAASKVITTSDELLQEILNLKR